MWLFWRNGSDGRVEIEVGKWSGGRGSEEREDAMAHGGYGRKNTGRAPLGRGGGRGRGGRGVGGVRKENEKKKSKLVSTKNQIRSIERLLKKVGFFGLGVFRVYGLVSGVCI